mgnify:CR=1 FL=1
MAFRDHDSGRSPNYLDAEKVVELLHVRHLEFVGEEELDLVDVDEMFTSNDWIFHIYNDDNQTCGIASYVEGVVQF